MNRRTLASIALAAACVVGLTACDIHSPDMELGFTANPDGTTTVTGLAADQDQAGTKLLVVVTVDGTTNNAVAANLPAAAWSPQRPFKCGNKDKDGNEQTCFLTVRLGEDHRFTATFTNPTDPEKLVCITPLGVAVAEMTPGADVMAALKANGNTLWSAFAGLEPGSMGETSVICALIGAAILILTGVGAWRIMAGCVIGAAAVSELFLHFGGEHLKLASDLPTLWQLCVGGFAFGAVFMATDPVSASATNTGKWIYGILIGALTITIRSAGGYPEAIMLVILLMNGLAPMIDHYVVQAHIKRRLAYVKAKG